MMKRSSTYFSYLLVLVLCMSNYTITRVFSQHRIDSLLSVHHYLSALKETEKKFFLPRRDSVRVVPAVKYQGTFDLKKGIKIFGWHPHWMGTSYKHYNYSLLTHIAYFSCEINTTTGLLKDLNGWDTTSFIPYVKTQNSSCNVLLTVTCFGESSLRSFLNDTLIQQRFIQQLYTVITSRGGNGVCIDFEGMTGDMKSSFTAFITRLRKSFEKQDLRICLTLPAIDTNPSPYDFDALNKNTDLFILMGYDYFGSFSKSSAGPIAPLHTATWIPASVKTSVNYYLERKVPDSLFLLGVPYYGAIWETQSQAVPSKPLRFVGYRSYSYALSFSLLPEFINDTLLKASYYRYNLVDNTSVNRQFWLDNEYSLGEKYDYVLQKKLGGVGIWALGFDEGSNDLWRLLQVKFAPGNNEKNAEVIPAGDSGSSSAIISEVMSLLETKPFLAGTGVFLVLSTLLVVLIKVVVDPANRQKLQPSGLTYLFYLSIAALFCSNFYVLCLLCFQLSVLVSSIALGLCLALAMTLLVIKVQRNKEMP